MLLSTKLSWPSTTANRSLFFARVPSFDHISEGMTLLPVRSEHEISSTSLPRKFPRLWTWIQQSGPAILTSFAHCPTRSILFRFGVGIFSFNKPGSVGSLYHKDRQGRGLLLVFAVPRCTSRWSLIRTSPFFKRSRLGWISSAILLICDFPSETIPLWKLWPRFKWEPGQTSIGPLSSLKSVRGIFAVIPNLEKSWWMFWNPDPG